MRTDPNVRRSPSPGRWLTWRGFSIGLIESFLYGVYAGGAYGLIQNALRRLWAQG